MSMLMRIVVITLALAAAGLVAGGAVGMVMMACWMVADGMFELQMLLAGGMFGGAMGAVLGPVAAWLLMRHVPLGVAIGGTAAGAIAGAVLGLLLGNVGASFYGALLGFGASAVVLRIRKPQGQRALTAAEDAPGIAPARDGV
ncbi:MAG TPA: hypothetical protein VE871_00995 [Longimicrobium sp.]|nr:hypothetical protein [Longimicrobium sp.]